MSADSIQQYSPLFKQLIQIGAWLVPLRGRYGVPVPEEPAEYSHWKAPTCSWKDRELCLHAVRARLKGNWWVGLIPSSLGLVVFDVDEGDPDALAGELSALDYNFVRVKTLRGEHFYLRATATWPSGNAKWQLAGCSGDVRYDAGYVVVWDPVALLEAVDLVSNGADEVLSEKMTSASLIRRGKKKPLTHERAMSLHKPSTIQDYRIPSWVLDITSLSYPSGARNDVLLRHLNRVAHENLRDNEAVVDHIRRAWLSAPLPKPGEDRGAIFDDQLERAVQHVRVQREEKIEDGIFPAKDEGALRQALANLKIAWAYNIRRGTFEFKRDEQPLVGVNQTALISYIISELAANFRYERSDSGTLPLRFSKDQFVQFMWALLTTSPERQIDDFLLWLERDLPEWDGVERMDGLLTELFGAEDTALTRWASRWLFLAPIQRASQPGCKLDETVVLIGKQGIGKSALLANLFPADKRDIWFTDSLDFTASRQEIGEVIEGAVVAEIAELAGIGRDWDRQKAILSSQALKWRTPYEVKAEARLFYHAWVGTADRIEALPNDPAGLRRFVSIRLHRSANVEEHMRINRQQLWAEAFSIFKVAATPDDMAVANLPRHLMDAQAEANEEYRMRDDEIEDAVGGLVPDKEGMLYADILKAVGMPSNVSPSQKRRLKAALTQAGWSMRTVKRAGKRGRRWFSPQSELLL